MEANAEHVTLTKPQRTALEYAARHGFVHPKGTGFGIAKRRSLTMLERLTEKGLLRESVHGGYEITDAGWAVIGPQTDASP